MTTTVEDLAIRVRQRFAAGGGDASVAGVAAIVRQQPGAAVLGEHTLRLVAERLAAEFGGAGPLTPLLADPSVTDVLVNGDEVWVDGGTGLRRVEVDLGGRGGVRRLAQRLAGLGGRRLDDASPYVDVQLPDGTRVHAVLPPVARGGPFLSLRTFRRRGHTLEDLVERGALPAGAAEVLAAVVAARLPYLVTGGTGCGKTTVLGALLALVPPDERIVLVEDAAELRPEHPHVVALQARTPNVEGAGVVTLRDLVRQALRMRPDRLVVGECRGAEIVDLLAALNTGHDGGAATLHANASVDVPARLEALGLLGGVPRAALHAQVAAALRVVVHLRRAGAARVVDEICLLTAPAGGLVAAVPAWRRSVGAGPAADPLALLLRGRGVRPPAVLSAPRVWQGATPAAGGPVWSEPDHETINVSRRAVSHRAATRRRRGAGGLAGQPRRPCWRRAAGPPVPAARAGLPAPVASGTSVAPAPRRHWSGSPPPSAPDSPPTRPRAGCWCPSPRRCRSASPPARWPPASPPDTRSRRPPRGTRGTTGAGNGRRPEQSRRSGCSSPS
jgi:pilus assembly protein CpaF